MSEDQVSFDPTKHMTTIRTKQGLMPYLAVKHRVLWLRADHPGASIVVEKVDGGVEAGWVEFKASVTLPDGTTAVDYASETKGDFPDFFEKASTKAIGRALALIGYGTDAAPDLDDGEPLDGAAASKAERAERKNTPEQREQVDAQHQRNTAPPPSTLPATRSPKATQAQITAIYAAATEKGVKPEEAKKFLAERYPKATDEHGMSSTRALTPAQASDFIDYLRHLPDVEPEDYADIAAATAAGQLLPMAKD